jgi:hypothetical protein
MYSGLAVMNPVSALGIDDLDREAKERANIVLIILGNV